MTADPRPERSDQDVPPQPAPEVAERSAADGWRTLARALKPRATTAQVLTGVLCALLGFAIALQVRSTGEDSLSTMRQSELVSLLDQTTRQADQLADQVNDLEQTRQELRSGSTSREAALEAATRSATAQGILSGRLPAQGPGVQITVEDPSRAVSALTLLNLLEELRNAGAEAVQINDQRVTASSSIVSTGGGIEVNDVPVLPPYLWSAIGDPETMSTAMAIPGGAVAKVQIDGGTARVEQRDLVQITALRTLTEPQYATPEPVPGE
ncbi:DUF881 domain-containing protein [Cellulomonas sp. NPDC089187]|uniref:DUF881 domain-containing protein n=1 Tax=Cellulomonas sp. NPDC089187 TaxID=3154970 RepID=UPI00341D7988